MFQLSKGIASGGSYREINEEVSEFYTVAQCRKRSAVLLSCILVLYKIEIATNVHVGRADCYDPHAQKRHSNK